MAEIVNKYNSDVNKYLEKRYNSPESETYKNYLIQEVKESTKNELRYLKDYIDLKKDVVISEDDKLQLMDLSNSLNSIWNLNQVNTNSPINDSNDVYREADIVFAGWSIQEKVKIIKNLKFDMKSELRNSPISWEIIELWNNVYELKLSRIDYDWAESWEILKLRLVYNNYWNTIQIFDEYKSRLIWEQIIHFPRNWHRYNDSRAAITKFNIKPYWDKWPLINIHLAFPNR